jgi:hypothetical protein
MRFTIYGRPLQAAAVDRWNGLVRAIFLRAADPRFRLRRGYGATGKAARTGPDLSGENLPYAFRY